MKWLNLKKCENKRFEASTGDCTEQYKKYFQKFERDGEKEYL